MYRKSVSCVLILCMALLSFVPQVEAGFSPSQMVGQVSQYDRSADLAMVTARLEHKMVSQRLSDFGYSTDEIQARLGGLSNERLHALAGQLDQVEPGGILDALLFIAIVVLAVVGVMHLTGKKVIIK